MISPLQEGGLHYTSKCVHLLIIVCLVIDVGELGIEKDISGCLCSTHASMNVNSALLCPCNRLFHVSHIHLFYILFFPLRCSHSDVLGFQPSYPFAQSKGRDAASSFGLCSSSTLTPAEKIPLSAMTTKLIVSLNLQ